MEIVPNPLKDGHLAYPPGSAFGLLEGCGLTVEKPASREWSPNPQLAQQWFHSTGNRKTEQNSTRVLGASRHLLRSTTGVLSRQECRQVGRTTRWQGGATLPTTGHAHLFGNQRPPP